MKRERLTVSPYGNAKDDLFYWIKNYIASKASTLKHDLGYNLDRLDRFEASEKLLNTCTIEEFKEVEIEIRNKGLRNLSTYANPLFALYDYFSNIESIQQITDFNTEYRDNFF